MIALALGMGLALAEEPFPARVRLDGPEAQGEGPFWDPGLTERSAAHDRALAWEALEGLETQRGAWYQRLALARLLRAPVELDDAVLEADSARLVAFFRERGWVEASARARRAPRRPGWEDVVFEVDLGPRAFVADPPPAWEPPATGWRLTPLASALGRGTTVSAYGGLDAAWRSTDQRPAAAQLRGEVGYRVFPSEEGLLQGTRGVWSDGLVEVSRETGRDVALLARARGGSDAWPGVSEASGSLAAGLRYAPRPQGWLRLSLEATAAAGLWTSWPGPGQEASYRLAFADPTVRPDLVPEYLHARVDLRLEATTTDRPVNPRRGVWVSLEATPVGWAAGAPLARADLDLRGFVPLVRRRWIASLRTRVAGLAWEDAAGRSLLGERFFLGAVELRAWDRRRIVPPGYVAGRFDLRPGGELLGYLGADLRWHVHRDLVLTAFVDTGRVWERGQTLRLADLLADAGLSLGVPSPLGHLRLDVAVRVRGQEGDTGLPGALQLWLEPTF